VLTVVLKWNEIIQHLNFENYNAKFIWRLVQLSVHIPLPLHVNHMFNDWLQEVENKISSLNRCVSHACAGQFS
jgi:hypothetical protein